MIYYNGRPLYIPVQVYITEGGVSGDVTGILDEDNNIVLIGNLAAGTYTLNYRNADNTYTNIGTLIVAAEDNTTAIVDEAIVDEAIVEE